MTWRRDLNIEMGPYTSLLPARHAQQIWDDLKMSERWPNFTVDELRSKGNGDLRIHYATLDALQKLRDLIKRPIVVTSYYRDPDYNARVGGANASYHMAGRAVDITTWATPLGQLELIHYGTLAGFKGFGFYDNFTHLDTGPHRYFNTDVILK